MILHLAVAGVVCPLHATCLAELEPYRGLKCLRAHAGAVVHSLAGSTTGLLSERAAESSMGECDCRRR